MKEEILNTSTPKRTCNLLGAYLLSVNHMLAYFAADFYLNLQLDFKVEKHLKIGLPTLEVHWKFRWV